MGVSRWEMRLLNDLTPVLQGNTALLEPSPLDEEDWVLIEATDSVLADA
jgi:hypothetical protein